MKRKEGWGSWTIVCDILQKGGNKVYTLGASTLLGQTTTLIIVMLENI
jgi:hypothetical protein